MSDINAFVASIESSLADIASSIEAANVAGGMAALESGLADAVEALSDRKGMAALIDAIKAWQPRIEVNVPPQPAPVVQFLPSPAECEWTLRLEGNSYGMPDRVLKITRTMKQVS